MKYQSLFFLLFFVLGFTQTSITAQNAIATKRPPTTIEMASPESVGMSTARLEMMEQRMHEFVDNGQLGCVQTAVMRKGKLIQFDTYGYQDVASKTPLQEHSIFRIYSMTKPIVSVALMMLYEEGKFQLNDPLHKYIPELENLKIHQGNGVVEPTNVKIRVIDILRHTSGFGYGWGNGYVDSLYRGVNRWALADTKAFIKSMSELPLYFEPGTKWKYSVSTDVCGYLVEVLSGQPLDQFLKERILDPLGMKDTHFEVPDAKDSRFITSYKPAKDGTIKVLDQPSTSRYTKKVTMFSGGGGMVSTAMDYLRFSQMLLNGGQLDGARILSPKTIQLMTSDHTKHIPNNGNGISLPSNGTAFGLGFAVTTDLADTQMLGSVGTYGWGGAAGTFFRIDPKEEMIVLLMIQLRPYNHLQAREYFQNMVYQAVME